MAITLDLFMDTTVDRNWHYAITALEIAVSVYLASYQLYRLYRLLMQWRERRRERRQSSSGIILAVCLLLFSAALQFVLIGLASWAYAVNADEAEWSMFAIALLWAVIHPTTYTAVDSAIANDEKDDAADSATAGIDQQREENQEEQEEEEGAAAGKAARNNRKKPSTE